MTCRVLKCQGLVTASPMVTPMVATRLTSSEAWQRTASLRAVLGFRHVTVECFTIAMSRVLNLVTGQMLCKHSLCKRYSVGCEPALGSYAYARDFLCTVAEITGGQAVALSSATSPHLTPSLMLQARADRQATIKSTARSWHN